MVFISNRHAKEAAAVHSNCTETHLFERNDEYAMHLGNFLEGNEFSQDFSRQF